MLSRSAGLEGELEGINVITLEEDIVSIADTEQLHSYTVLGYYTIIPSSRAEGMNTAGKTDKMVHCTATALCFQDILGCMEISRVWRVSI